MSLKTKVKRGERYKEINNKMNKLLITYKHVYAYVYQYIAKKLRKNVFFSEYTWNIYKNRL